MVSRIAGPARLGHRNAWWDTSATGNFSVIGKPLGSPGSDPAIAGHSPDSLTQKAVARLSRCRSIRNWAFSRRASASSAHSEESTRRAHDGRYGPGAPSSPPAMCETWDVDSDSIPRVLTRPSTRRVLTPRT